MTTPSDITGDLNALGDRCLELSRAWFPELFERGLRELVAHYGLGLIGELGEVEELLESGGYHAPGLGHELADVLTYAVGLGRMLEFDIHHATHYPYMLNQNTGLVAVGLLANAIKKVHRMPFLDLADPGSMTDQEIGVMLEVKEGTAWALRKTLALADRAGIDLSEAWHSKMAVLEERWGHGLKAEDAALWIGADNAQGT